tara:strand:+ start:3264 stop:4376 length:1113 start_codon:yes stop_codon:yes gene_type:complete
MNLKSIIEENIDKSTFIRYKFSDFVENITEKVVPRESKLDHYIGLEHLDSGSLKINRFGDPKSLKGEKLKIYKGDIIFAKRNAYLKRASIADFDAVASAHSMVLRAKSEVISAKFLPFFMQSDSFWNTAIRISVGGLSPTINWKTMANQEFLLPPKNQQEKIAELLWSVDNLKLSYSKLYERMNMYNNVIINELLCLNDNNFNNDWKEDRIENISPLQRGFDLPKNKIKKGEYPVCFSNGIGKYHNEFKIKGPGVVTGRSGTIGNVFYINEDFWPHNTTLWVTNFKGNFPKYIYYLYSNLNFQKMQAGTGVPTLNRNIVHKFKTRVPIKYEDQKIISNKIDNIKINENKVLKILENSKKLQLSLINEIFL